MPLIFCPPPSLSQIKVRPSGASLGAASIHLTGAVRNGQATKVTFLNGLRHDAMNAGANLSLAVEVLRGVARTLIFMSASLPPFSRRRPYRARGISADRITTTLPPGSHP